MSLGSMVGWKDYESVEGFGATTVNDVNDLNKALHVGSERDPPASAVAGDGFALRVESLEKTLKVVTHRMEHIVFWRNITKLPEWNTVGEYSQLKSYGQNLDAGWIAEGALPTEDDTTYERKFSVVKFLGTTRKVSHVATVIKPAHGDILASEGVNGTMHLLEIIERALFSARSDLSGLQFDGFEKLMEDDAPAANIIDLRGRPLSEDVLIDGSLTASDSPNYGRISDLYCNPKVKADLVKVFFPKARYDLYGKTTDGMIGGDMRGWNSPSGPVRFHDDVFVDDGGSPTAAVGNAIERPAEPTVTTGVTTPPDATALFEADDAGDYFYTIVAVNDKGRSAGIPLVAGPPIAAVAVTEGDKVTFGVTPGSGITVKWYEIFRTKVNGAEGTERLILRVPSAGAGATVINDLNESLPYTTTAYGFQGNRENMAIRQLAPLVRIPLATIDSSIRFMILCYMVPQLYSPGKNVLYKNVGRAAGYVGQP